MNSSKLLIGCGIALILVLGVLFIVGVFASIPGVDQQLPPGMSSALVNISLPLNGAALPLNQPFSVYVQAFGDQPLQDIQLLVDGVPQPNGSSSPAGDKKMMASWAFTPVKEGVYTLLARVNTRNGQTGTSNAVNVNVLPPDQMPLPVVQGGVAEPLVINDETGQTEQGTVPEGGIPAPPPFPDQGDGGNPPLPQGPADQEPPDEPSQQPGDNFIPIKYALWFQNLFSVDPPAAPKLDGGANQCDGILVVQDNSTDELGFFLYRLGPGQQAFSRVATLDGKAGKAVFSYHDPGLASGKYFYYMSAFNAGGESASNIISLTVVAPQCAAANKPKFDVESIPIDPGQPLDKAYCYGSASGMPWVRLPYGQNNFIYPANGKFDLAPYWNSIPLPQPMPPQVTLNMECWGWSGTTLIYLGASSQTFSGGSPGPTPPPGQDGTLGEPPKALVASPFNAHISNKPDDCKDHVPNNPGAVQQCKDYMASNAGFFLFWDYNRYGDCNPGAEYCDMSLQLADGFNIYTVKEGKAVLYSLHSLGVNYHYVPAFDQSNKDEYFVRAVFHYLDSNYNPLGYESGDSNHVLFPQQVETKINPTSVETNRWGVQNYGGITPHWDTVTAVGPGELISGYAFTCLNNCSQGQYGDFWYTGVVKFDLPANIDIRSARLNWKTMWYTTSGPGANNVIMSCGIHLDTGPGGLPLSNSPLWGIESYDASQPVLQAKMDGQESIEFLFVAPMQKEPGVRWDRCLWFIKNFSLSLYYYP